MKFRPMILLISSSLIVGCDVAYEDIPSRLARGDTTVCADQELIDSVLQDMAPTGVSFLGLEILSDAQAAQGVAAVGAYADTISASGYDRAISELRCEAILNIEDSRHQFSYLVRPSADGQGYVYEWSARRELTAAWGAAVGRHVTDAIEAADDADRAEAERFAASQVESAVSEVTSQEEVALPITEPNVSNPEEKPTSKPSTTDGQWSDEEYAAARARQ